jgi:hypothetical protein
VLIEAGTAVLQHHSTATPNKHTKQTQTPTPTQGELDELEREEFFRLKKVQKNKQKVAAKAEADKLADQVRGCVAEVAGLALCAFRRRCTLTAHDSTHHQTHAQQAAAQLAGTGLLGDGASSATNGITSSDANLVSMIASKDADLVF